jgi:hypothetical protein
MGDGSREPGAGRRVDAKARNQSMGDFLFLLTVREEEVFFRGGRRR